MDPKETENQPNSRKWTDGHGRFARGNPGGPGNPNVKYATKFKLIHNQVFDEIVTKEEYALATKACLEKAKKGDVYAWVQLSMRMAGPITDAQADERIEAIEEALRDRGIAAPGPSHLRSSI